MYTPCVFMCVYVHVNLMLVLVLTMNLSVEVGANKMDGVPLKIPHSASQKVKDDVKVVVPDYLTILQDTEVSNLNKSIFLP